MALPALQAQLKNYIQSMFDEGLLDEQFAYLQALEDETNPKELAETISLFCNEGERIMTELNKNLDEQMVDCKRLDDTVHRLKGQSISIGTYRLRIACAEFHQAWEAKNKQWCLQILNIIACEYCLVRSKFQTLLQLWKRISAVETNQQ